MARCQFCGGQFANSQAVRAHLKGCAAYQGKSPRQAASPKAMPAMPPGDPLESAVDGPQDEFDRVRQMQGQLTAEKLRLRLREVDQAHADLDAREKARRGALAKQEAEEAERRRAADQARGATHLQALADAAARRQTEEARAGVKAKRREAIQATKRKAVDGWAHGFGLGSELKAEILQAIESALAPLPVEELPAEELVHIAAGVRDRLHAEALAVEQAASACQQQKEALQRYGIEYGQAELAQVEGLDGIERWRIESLIKRELEALEGDESRAEVKDWVDEILDEKGLGFEDEEAE